MKKQELEKLKKYISESKNIVFFGGAGVSTESGIPDFRTNEQESSVFQIPRWIVHNLSLMRDYIFSIKK